MNCSQARDRIVSSSIDDEVRAHVSECDACAELSATDGQLGRALGQYARPEADPEAFEKITQITSEQDADAVWRLRHMPTNRRLAIALCASLVGATVFFLVWRRPDWSVYPVVQMIVVVVAMAIATGFGVVLSMPRAYRPERPFPLRLALLGFLLAIPFVPALLPIAHEAHPASVEPNLWVGIGKCLGLGTLAAFPALITIRLLQRDQKLELWPTIFAALAAALGANIALQVHCPVVDPAHIAIGHGAMAMLYAGLAWLVVRATVR